MNTKKRCPRCTQTKTPSEFYKSKTQIGGLSSYCRSCQNEYVQRDYATNPEKHKERIRRWRIKNVTPTYVSWYGMLSRCRNSKSDNYPRYGGRGITVCERWLSFESFLIDMGERPEGLTIDRIDPDENYEPNNCRWATAAEQRANWRKRV